MSGQSKLAVLLTVIGIVIVYSAYAVGLKEGIEFVFRHCKNYGAANLVKQEMSCEVRK
jgi:hypothetical protein